VLRGNRARGILLGSRGPMVIEGNTFHIPGAAILFEGDSRFWFEQAGVRDVVIRGNTFDNCNYGVWGTGTIQVGSGIADEFKSVSRYNRNIRIENNLFRHFSNLPLLSIYSVDGLTFTGNRLERTTDLSRTESGRMENVPHHRFRQREGRGSQDGFRQTANRDFRELNGRFPAGIRIRS
jgi:hypothetical protein